MGDFEKISVIIPTFNRGEFLASTLDSIFGQSVSVHEIILIDDGSTDGSETTVSEYLQKRPEHARKFRYIKQKNEGKSVALNRGLSAATGDWFAFDDSDDTWHPDKLAAQVRALKAHPNCGACFTDAQFTSNSVLTCTAFQNAQRTYSSETGMIEDGLRFVLQMPHGVYMQTVMVSSEAMTAVGEFDPLLRVAQDRDFVFRLALKTRLCYVNRPLVNIDRADNRKIGLMTQHGLNSITRLRAQEYMAYKWMLLAADSPYAQATIRILLRSIRSQLSDALLLNGDVPAARNTLLQSLASGFSAKRIAKAAALYACPGQLRSRLIRRCALVQ